METRNSFELQPTLSGELLTLRPLTPHDFDALFAVASDPLVWEQHPAFDRYQEPVFRKLFKESLDSGGALVALDHSDGRVIGSSRFHGYDAAKSEIEIGWSFLARSYWGGRYNGEMKRLMLHHAFQFVDRVVFFVGITNIRSQRAMENIGGVRTRTHRAPDGRESVIFEITAERFATR